MKCTNCGGARLPIGRVCGYCGWVFATDHVPPLPPPATNDAASFDEVFDRLEAHPRTRELLAERPPDDVPVRPGARNLLPLLVGVGFAAAVVWAMRGADGTLPRAAAAAAATFVAFGLLAVVLGARRATRIRSAPVEALPARLGERDLRPGAPVSGDEDRLTGGRGRTRWSLHLSGGRERRVWPRPGVEAGLRRGAAGVAYVKGPYLLGFEPVEV